MRRLGTWSLLGWYLAASLLAVGLPHTENCATRFVDGHAHDSHPASPLEGVHVEASHFDGIGDAAHDDECATCKFLSLRYLAAPADPNLLVERAIEPLTRSGLVLDLARPRSPHEARGPPA